MSELSLGTRTKQNGMLIYDLCCLACGGKIRSISKSRFEVLLRAGVGVGYADEAEAAPGMAGCVVRGCSHPGYERHHFAPSAAFGWREAERWPVLPLCRPHHTGWHRAMNGYRGGHDEPLEFTSAGAECVVRSCGENARLLLRLGAASRFPDSDNWPWIPVCEDHYREYRRTMDGYHTAARRERSEAPPVDLTDLNLFGTIYWMWYAQSQLSWPPRAYST